MHWTEKLSIILLIVIGIIMMMLCIGAVYFEQKHPINPDAFYQQFNNQ